MIQGALLHAGQDGFIYCTLLAGFQVSQHEDCRTLGGTGESVMLSLLSMYTIYPLL